MQTYNEGDVADGPNGPLVFSGGVWVPIGGSTPQPMTIGTRDPRQATQAAMDQMRLAQMAREAANAPTQLERDRLALERERLGIEKDRRVMATAPTGKALREGDGDKLEKAVGTYGALKGALGNFNDDYAGNAISNGIENAAQRRFGTGTPGQADWWSNFYATDNVIRNGLYGASLTDGEKQAYAATTIDPSMRPDLIRQNLARRAEIVRGALARKVARFKAGGYNPAEIDATTGEFGTDLAPGYKAPKLNETQDKTAMFVGSGADNNGDSGGQMGLAGSTRTERDPVLAGVNTRINGMLKSGASDDAIRSYIQQIGAPASPASVTAALAWRRKNPGYKGNYSVDIENRDVPMTPTRQAFQSVGAGPVGSFTVAATDALTGGRVDELAGMTGGNSSQAEAAKRLLANVNPTSSMAGTIGGAGLAAYGGELGLARMGVAGGAGLLAPRSVAGDALYGAYYGSGDNNEDRVGGALAGGLASAAGGVAGRGIIRGGGATLGGVQNQAVDLLRRAGVRLTLGQAVGNSGRLGAAVKGFEDRLSGIPGVGALSNARRVEGMQDFNRAAFDQALQPVGGSTRGVVGEQGIEAAQDLVHDAYGRALDGVTVQADGPFINDMRGVVAQGRALPEPMAGRAGYTLGTRVGQSFSPNGELTGNGFQQSRRGLNRDAAAVAREPYGYDFGEVTDGARGALEGMVNRQAPDVVPAYRRAAEAFRLTQVLRDAVNRGRNGSRTGQPGLFAPSQLADAAAQNARRFGNTQGTTQQPFFDLARAGQEVLPSTVPDSGTAGRMMVQQLAVTGGLAGAGAGAGYASGDTKTGLAVGAALAALQTQAAQRALVAAVLNRPQVARRGADYLARNADTAAAIGSGLGVPLMLEALPAQ